MIPEHLTYFFVNFLTIFFPLLFSFTEKFDFKKYWRYYFPANLIVASIYIIWDIYYTSIGVWGFHLQYTTGIKIFNLPIEEIGFFICTPFACLFTYYCFKKYVFSRIRFDIEKLWLISAFVFLVVAFCHYHRLYTFAAFLSCAIASSFAYYIRLVRFEHFYIFYAVILIPFIIFNGILTGSFLHRVVVHYNDSENLGIRILTIPFEDIFYGMAMLLFHILLMEFLNEKSK